MNFLDLEGGMREDSDSLSPSKLYKLSFWFENLGHLIKIFFTESQDPLKIIMFASVDENTWIKF